MNEKEALEAYDFHENGSCYLRQGPRGGLVFHFTAWRKNGKIKTWKTKPGFKIPIKHGFYGPYDYLTQDNIKDFHLPDECLVFEMLREQGKSARYEGYRFTNRYNEVEIANN